MHDLAFEGIHPRECGHGRVWAAQAGAEDDVLYNKLALLLQGLPIRSYSATIDGNAPFVSLRVLRKGRDGRGRPDIQFKSVRIVL